MLRWASVVMAALALTSACSTQVVQTMEVPPSAIPTHSPTTVPTANPEQVLLRLSTEPTMAPYPGQTVDPPPPFTLYADGRAIYTDYVLNTLEGTALSVREAQLSDDQVDDLISFALGDGGLADANGYYEDHGAATDQDKTVFELHNAGVDRRVLAYGLGDTSANNPDAAIRSKLERLARRLQNFGADVANGGGEDLGPYEPTAYFVSLSQAQDAAINPVRGWPWPDLHPSDFLTQPEHGRQLTPEQALELTDDPLGAPNDLLIAGPDAGAYIFRIRALLPDQVVPTH